MVSLQQWLATGALMLLSLLASGLHALQDPTSVGCCSDLPPWMEDGHLPGLIITIQPEIEIVNDPKVKAHLCACESPDGAGNVGVTGHRQDFNGEIGIEVSKKKKKLSRVFLHEESNSASRRGFLRK
jgi:hypothetical protein